jgi:hypothetical protein
MAVERISLLQANQVADSDSTPPAANATRVGATISVGYLVSKV